MMGVFANSSRFMTFLVVDGVSFHHRLKAFMCVSFDGMPFHEQLNCHYQQP
ncbi:hypothetical protein M758_3G093800 [Ceratodon purpureus]|nr:hypothetical protein M758_3G093800 [Ceratodon purpureus]